MSFAIVCLCVCVFGCHLRLLMVVGRCDDWARFTKHVKGFLVSGSNAYRTYTIESRIYAESESRETERKLKMADDANNSISFTLSSFLALNVLGAHLQFCITSYRYCVYVFVPPSSPTSYHCLIPLPFKPIHQQPYTYWSQELVIFHK